MKVRQIVLYAAVLVILLALSACSGGKVRDDVAVSDIIESIDAVIESGGNMDSADTSYIEGYIGLDAGLFTECGVQVRALGVNVDEYGVFRCADESKAKELLGSVEDYLRMRDESWMPEYMPEERPKVQKAEAKSAGSYVVYAILSDEDREKAFEAFDKSIRG